MQDSYIVAKTIILNLNILYQKFYKVYIGKLYKYSKFAIKIIFLGSKH